MSKHKEKIKKTQKMSENIQATTGDILYTDAERVACDGPDFSKHPRVYLTLKGGVENEVVCPYCGKTFRKKKSV